VNAVIAEATKVGKPASTYKVNKDNKMSQAFLDAVATNKDNKNKLGNKPKPPKYPNVNDVDLGIDGTKPQGGKPGKTSLADDEEEDEEGEDVDGEEEEDPDDGEEEDDGDEEDDEDDEEEDDLAF